MSLKPYQYRSRYKFVALLWCLFNTEPWRPSRIIFKGNYWYVE